MILNIYVICLFLFKCVFVYSKNQTTYTLNPHLSQVKLLSLPKKALFWGEFHQNSDKNKSRRKINTHFLHKDLDDENDGGDYNYEQKNPEQTNLNSEDSGEPPEQPQDDNETQASDKPDFQGQKNSENGFLDESSSGGINYQQNTDQNENNNNNSHNENSVDNNPHEDENGSNQIEENKKIVDDIAKEEHMKQMHTNAGQMLDSAKQAKEKADELLKQFKQGEYSTETNKHTMPKDEAGNIIITNTTTTPTPKKEEEKVDPLKSIRDATLSLFERAKHKNLPVTDPGHLSTPEQIYAALNSLEYIIDGYRYSKIDLNDDKNQGNKATEASSSDVPEFKTQSVSPEDSNPSSDRDEEDVIMDPDRFLQLKHKNDDEEGEENEDEENEGEDRDEDFHKDDSEERDQDNEETGDEMKSGEHEGGTENKQNDGKGPALTPHQAVEDLKGVLAELTSVLEQVVQDSIGVKNVIKKTE